VGGAVAQAAEGELREGEVKGDEERREGELRRWMGWKVVVALRELI
jgi:hypothetical protein